MNLQPKVQKGNIVRLAQELSRKAEEIRFSANLQENIKVNVTIVRYTIFGGKRGGALFYFADSNE